MALIFIISCLLMLTSDAYAATEIVRLRCYVHDLRAGSGSAATVYNVASASITSTSPTSFGSVNVVDDLLTAEPSINSTAVGRIQGLTTSADLSVTGVALNLNFYFTAGQFNGSTISIIGRNQVMLPQRELAVVGGTGAFQRARGYALQTTYSYDTATSYAVLEFNIYTTRKLNQSNLDIEITPLL